MAKPRFAYLLLKEHPYGREMLRQILSGGYVPEIIIEEDSAVGDEEREKFLKRIEGNPIAPSIANKPPKTASLSSPSQSTGHPR